MEFNPDSLDFYATCLIAAAAAPGVRPSDALLRLPATEQPAPSSLRDDDEPAPPPPRARLPRSEGGGAVLRIAI